MVDFGNNSHMKTFKIFPFPNLLDFIRKWGCTIMELDFILYLTSKT